MVQQEQLEKVCRLIAGKAADTEYADGGPEQEFTWLAEAGALEIVLPGRPLDFNQPYTPALLRLLKEVGKANLSVGRIFEGHINALYLIHLFARPDQKKRWYDEVIDHKAIFGVWNTQQQDGTSFSESGDVLIMQGRKTFCSGAGLLTHAIVTGDMQTNNGQGWQMSVVNMAGLAENIDRSTWKTLGMRASCSFNVDFTGYRLAADDLLGLPGQYFEQPYFSAGAIRFAAVQLGGAESIMEHGVHYLQSLKRTKDPFQQTRIARMTNDLITGRLWLAKAGNYFDDWLQDPEKKDSLIAFANMTRTATEEICLRIMEDCNRCVGARGLMHPFDLERIQRDLTFYLRQPAPDATRLDIGRFTLENFNAFNEIGA
ncbi:MAG: acyl-CoA dehydrogenase [Mucilaginibacter polytrichastri]|nr:acyl-CoA dehydrogenase [Mucilaginibacter polytrichastri]